MLFEDHISPYQYTIQTAICQCRNKISARHSRRKGQSPNQILWPPAGVAVEYTANALTNAGSIKVTATFTGDTANYNAISDMTATLTIEKAVPSYTVPEGLTATAGQALDEIELPDGWSWAEGSLTLNEGGECTVTAIYTPEDTDNYQTVAVEITVNVLPAGLPVWAVVLIVLGCAAVVAVVIVLIVRGKKKQA